CAAPPTWNNKSLRQAWKRSCFAWVCSTAPAPGTTAQTVSRRCTSMLPPRRPCLRSHAARPASTTSLTTTEQYRSRKRVVSLASIRLSEHDPEKACPGLDPGSTPVFRKDHAPRLGFPFSFLYRGLFDRSFAGGRWKRLAEKARAFQPIAPRLLGGFGDADA